MRKQYTKPTAVGVQLQTEAPLLSNSSYEVSTGKTTDTVLSNEKGWNCESWQTNDSED